MLVEVFVKMSVVLAKYLEEDSVLLWVFQLCYVETRASDLSQSTVDQLLTAEDAMYLKAFQKQAIPDTETISLTYFPCWVIAVDPNIP